MTVKEKIVYRIKNNRCGSVMFRYYVNLKYFGFKLRCPFCHFSGRHFLEAGFDYDVIKRAGIVGGGLRENSRCPNCRSSDRECLVYLYLIRKTDKFKKSIKVLHVAPEAALQNKFKRNRKIKYYSVDLNSRLADYKMDIRHIDFEDNFFDLIICNHVLEHIADDHLALAELYQVLKSGGLAILQVPISSLEKTLENPDVKDPQAREKIFGQKDHVRIYGQDYPERLMAAGFETEVFSFSAEYGLKEVRRYGLISDEKIYLGRKK